jgi:hypothetical protein
MLYGIGPTCEANLGAGAFLRFNLVSDFLISIHVNLHNPNAFLNALSSIHESKHFATTKKSL